MTIKNFDIDGNLVNKVGIKGIRDIIMEFGKVSEFKRSSYKVQDVPQEQSWRLHKHLNL